MSMDHDARLSPIISLDRWALIPAPEGLKEVISSQDVQSVPRYSAVSIAEAMLSFPGVVLLSAAEPDWWDWRSCLSGNESRVEIDFTLLEVEDVANAPGDIWGGSLLYGSCTLALWLAFFEHLRAHFPGVHMHNEDTEIHTPSSFQEWVDDYL